jgi:hypothetical protein
MITSWSADTHVTENGKKEMNPDINIMSMS